MCIVETNIGNEKRNAFNIFTVNVFPERSDSELLQTIIQYRTQNSCKQVHVHSCRSTFFVEYSVCYHLVISTV